MSHFLKAKMPKKLLNILDMHIVVLPQHLHFSTNIPIHACKQQVTTQFFFNII